jgi:precorrin-6B methylase 2
MDPRFHPNSRFHFHGYREIVIIEVPRYVDLGGIPPVMPGSSWSEPGFYADPPASARTRPPGQLAPFDPTPQEVVERMLALAGVKTGDVVYDLGAGDGRVVIAAAKKYGAKAVGFEIDPGLVKLARENVRKQGVDKLVEIRQQDFLTADLSPATVVALYLSYDGNLALRPQLMRQLKPGARIVSYTFNMADWQPKIVEAYRDAAGESHALYLWEIGRPVVFSDLRR